MGARLFGKHLGSKPDNDNQPRAKANEIPLEHDERRTAFVPPDSHAEARR